MGFHSFLQSQGVPIESAIGEGVEPQHVPPRPGRMPTPASRALAAERGPCPDASDYGFDERFSNKLAIAPTASISIICGGSSPGIEPNVANAFTHKTLSGSFSVRNKYLKALLAEKGQDTDDVWTSITVNEGSVAHLDFLSDDEKDIFKTAFEIDQRWLVDFAADRAPFVCQSQSLNVFLPADVHKKTLHEIHFQAWKKGVKSLYYCRSRSIQRADKVANKVDVALVGNGATAAVADEAPIPLHAADGAAAETPSNDYEECLACQ